MAEMRSVIVLTLFTGKKALAVVESRVSLMKSMHWTGIKVDFSELSLSSREWKSQGIAGCNAEIQ